MLKSCELVLKLQLINVLIALLFRDLSNAGYLLINPPTVSGLSTGTSVAAASQKILGEPLVPGGQRAQPPWRGLRMWEEQWRRGLLELGSSRIKLRPGKEWGKKESGMGCARP